jgi:glycine/D-amino acid oxidase-like deaminating enzyme
MSASETALRALEGAKPLPFWLDDPSRPEALPPLAGETRSDVAIVGGGFTGLWAAIEAKERDPGRDVLLLEGGRVGWAASGRNGGFLASSLTHGLENGIARFPDEIGEIERQAADNFIGIRDALTSYGIDAEWEETAMVLLARQPHQASWFAEAAATGARFGHELEVLDREAVHERILRSPVYVGGLSRRGTNALVHPAKLAWGLRDAALGLGVRIFEGSPVRAIESEGTGMRLTSRGGSVHAKGVVLATNAYGPLVRQLRRRIVPVYDHVLMTEPLSVEQRASIGWSGREGLGDAANQFHYFRLSADDRILWGGYDATYHFGSSVRRRFEQDDEVHGRLAEHFFETFPQLEGVRFTHRWGGAIDSSSRFSVFFGTAFDGRLAYAAGYTGLGVGATRFGARTALDLVDGLETERTALEMVRRKPLPFPPEPVRWLGIRAAIRAYEREDRTGERGAWLRLLDRIGLGFQS